MKAWAWKCMGLALVAAAVHGLLPAQGGCIPVWQGFEQRWGYNHRIHRLGDWVEHVDGKGGCGAHLVHAAASGSGADSATFTQYYALLRNTILVSQEGVATLELAGRENELIEAEQVVDVPLQALDDPYAHCAAVLNGFDLVTADGAQADKLRLLEMGIDSTWRDDDAPMLHLRLRARLRFSCSSGECEPLNQVVDYRLRLHWLALAGQGLATTASTFGSGRSWPQDDTTDIKPAAVALLGDARHPSGLAGITSLRIRLDQEHHMLGWESSLQGSRYAQGLLNLDLRMGFVQNDRGMRAAFKERYQGRPKPPARWAVKHAGGDMVWEMGLLLLQFEGGEVVMGQHMGGLQWSTRHGRQAAADGKAAEAHHLTGSRD